MTERLKSLSGKIFTSVLVFTVAVVLVMGVVLTSIFYFSYESEEEGRLLNQARDVAAMLDAQNSSDDVERIVAYQCSDTIRYTLIGADGVVVYDSLVDSATMENHANRPEVVAAESSGSGSVVRYSETAKSDTLYAAVHLDSDQVIRLSEQRESLWVFMRGLLVPMLVTLVCAVALVFVLSRRLTQRIMEPIDAIDFTQPLKNDVYDEMTPFVQRIDAQQAQLKAQNEELAHAESMRRDFSSNVSHEMKTPLQVISGYAELMKNGLVPAEDVGKFSGLIYDEAQVMRSLINDVLTISRLDETSFDADTSVRIDVRAMAEKVESRLASFAAKANVSLEVTGEGGVVSGDETLVEEMLYNLVENGIRYNCEGGVVQVDVRVKPGDIDGHLMGDPNAVKRCVVIRVEDTGPGIPPDMREKVFERFFRIDKSRSKETGGTGLGLAIVKHAVLYHNGSINIVDGREGGSAFVIRIPEARD